MSDKAPGHAGCAYGCCDYEDWNPEQQARIVELETALASKKPPPAYLRHACDRLCAAAEEFLAGVERLREQPELDDTVGELFLRSIVATSFWVALRHAVHEWERERKLT